jgi:hypothetical protein
MTTTPFDWSTVEWSTYVSHPWTGAQLQYADIGPNTWWRVAQHDYDTKTDTELWKYPHESEADKAYRWIITREERIADLAELRARVAVGWTVDITDHDYISDSRDGSRVTEVTDTGIVIKPLQPLASQGRRFPTVRLTWSDEMVTEGDTVHLYRVGTAITSRSTPGIPRLSKTYRFHPPRGH